MALAPPTHHADGRLDLKCLPHDDLRAWMVDELGERPQRATRLFQAIWKRGVLGLDDVPEVSHRTRAAIAEVAHLSILEPTLVLRSVDGTVKFLWKLHDGHAIESVLIPDGDRLTLCVSSQVGCAMACSFCLTGDLGLTRHLSAAEIAGQVLQVQQLLDEGVRITNVVLMGMGEPLHNLESVIAACRLMMDDHGLNISHRRITVSTVGLVPQMKELASRIPVNLAISLHATDEAQRRELMPISKKHDIEELIEACRTLPLHGKRLQFEYLMVAGVNDTDADADRLVALLDGVAAKVNLIPYNENPDRDLQRPTDERVATFRQRLLDQGLYTTIRITRGLDVSAACGQLGKAWSQASDGGWLASARRLAGLGPDEPLTVPRGARQRQPRHLQT